MPPEIANHVAAVTLFGTPSDQFLREVRRTDIAIGPLYQPKTLQLCAPGDRICGDGGDPAAHAVVCRERHDGPSRELRRESPVAVLARGDGKGR